MDSLSLIFLVAAAVIFVKLRNVLGQRTGHERSPFDTRPAPRLVPKEPEAMRDITPVSVVTRAEAPAEAKPAEAQTPLQKILADFAKRDPGFAPDKFMAGAKIAYELVINAFAAGERATLKRLLSPEVYASFDAAIAEREKRGETLESRFVGINKAEMVAASVQGPEAHITVRFVTDLVQATRDRAGDVIEGDAQTVSEITDVWTFERELTSTDPNWRVGGTGSA